jgi:hypothetical protein
VLYFKIRSKVILAFIILITRDLIKEPLSRRFTLFIKCIVLQLLSKVLLNNKCYAKSSIIYIFILIPLAIKLKLRSVALMLNKGYKGFKTFNSLIKLSAKVFNNIKSFKVFILYFYFKIT